jgi:RAB protein geranylgeranyltransferase component A
VLIFFSNRFANAEGAFIYPMYGHGELPQAFCRFAAVKGALYVRPYPQSISGFGFTL